MDEIERFDNGSAAAFEVAFSRLRARIDLACAGEEKWVDGVAAALVSVLEFAVEDPEAARSLTAQALARGAEGFAQRERLLDYGSKRLEPGREVGTAGVFLPGLTERGLVGGLVMLIARRVDQGREAELMADAAEIVQGVLVPYVGLEEAKQAALRQAC
jgi:hypothetical protein